MARFLGGLVRRASRGAALRDEPMDQRELARIVRNCLERQLFSVSESMVRTADPDMLTRPIAQLLREALPPEE